ncbi:MAG: polysaccharide deacetylase family protein, partial [Lachnospiraceae bacterium]|nr:polysaccharide deacetylase family protein [Lachnospiraceae bacterium]
TLTGAADGDNMAKVELYVGGQQKGTFYYGDANVADYTIENVSHGTGNQKVELKVTADDGSWDVYLDKLTISAAGTAGGNSGTNSGSNNQGGNQGGNNNSGLNASSKLIALSFDDGPSSTTPYVLDVLEQNGVVATFFLIGQQVNSDTMSTMQRQINMGCELANHSYTHEDMSNMSASDVKNQIEWTSSAIKNTVGVDVKFFRPPYLGVSNTMYQNINLAFIAGVDSKDYENISSSQVTSNVVNGVRDGSIVLMHDFQGNNKTVEALPNIIRNLKNQGYNFVTISELFQIKGKNPNQGYKIWSNVFD